MKENVFEKVNEKLYTETLDNGLELYLYPTKKTKNFYISITVKYGARVNKYKVGNKTVDIIPGSAHFLEHKVMALSENQEISRRINELGSLANAWTNYYGTNYNIFGSINLIENLKLLLDIFYNIDINDKCVEEEKGIIGEEIDMYKDDINSYMYSQIFKNLFNTAFIRNTVVGERSDIEKITAKGLNEIYNDYYAPNNTFIIVTGDFDTKEVSNVIHEYMDKLKLKRKELPEMISEKEEPKVSVPYQEIVKDSDNTRIKYAVKMDKKRFKYDDDLFLRYYIGIIMSANFSATSPLYEKYKNEGIVISMSGGVNIVDDYAVLMVSAICQDGDRFIKNIEKDIKHLTLDKVSFERKKKTFLKSYIIDFDSIEEIEYDICETLLMDNKVYYDEYSLINDMTYEKACEILNSFTFENISVITTSKE